MSDHEPGSRVCLVGLMVMALAAMSCSAEPVDSPVDPNGACGRAVCPSAGSASGSTSTPPTAGTRAGSASSVPVPSTAGAGTIAGAGPSAGKAAPAQGVAGSRATAGVGAGSAGKAAAGSGGVTPAAGAGGNLAGVPSEELQALRQTCVDEINRYRATLPALMLAPLVRATADQEACSDKGAQMDGDSRMAHGAARTGLCRSVGLGAENTCPSWGVGGFSGNATLADALKGCLKAMWEEGEPPSGRDACIADVSGCFQAHGHYLNMSGTANAVACSFYKMSDGKYWMNQDFSQR